MGTSRQITQSFTMNGTDAFVQTSLPIGFQPISFIVGGVSTPTKQLNVVPNDGTSWYWNYRDVYVFRQSLVAPAFGTVITIIYEPYSSNLAAASVPSSVANLAAVNTGVPADPDVDSTYNYTPTEGSGVYSQVYDSLGVASEDQAAAVTAGVLRRTSAQPTVISFRTDVPGWRIGQTLHTNHAGHGLTSDFVVVSISAQPARKQRGRGSYMEYTIEAAIIVDTTDYTQSPADPAAPTHAITSIFPITATQPYERLNTATKIQPPMRLIDKWQVIIGSGGDLVAGVPLGNRAFIMHNQTLREIYVLPDPAYPPGDQTLEVDVLLNGVSMLFETIKVLAGASAPVAGIFAGYPVVKRAFRGDIVTFGVAYSSIGGSPVAARNVTVQWEGDID